MRVLRVLGAIVYVPIVALGVPMLGWALASPTWEFAGFFDHPARIAFIVLVAAQALVRAYVMLAAPWVRLGSLDTYRVGPFNHGQRVAFEAVMLLAPFCDRTGLGAITGVEAVRYAGLVLYALGVLWSTWALLAPGRPYTIQGEVPEDFVLFTSGPYRLLRQPRLFGLFLWAVGLSLIFRAWPTLIIVAALLVLIAQGIGQTERCWAQALGEPWDTYAARTRRVIPYIW